MVNLRLMIDECYWSLASYLNGVCKNVSAVTSQECGCPSGTRDPQVVEATRKSRRILVTQDDSTIKRHTYPPCTHGGIIYIQSKSLLEPDIKKMFRIFCLSSKTEHVVGHLTYLYRDHAEILTHKERIIVRWFGSGRKRRYETHIESRDKNDLKLRAR